MHSDMTNHEQLIGPDSSPKKIATFFYGSFIRTDVMEKVNFRPEAFDVAKLRGYDIDFDPYANIFRSEQHSICGILVYASHEELNAMYGQKGVGVYLPEAVIIETVDNRYLPAMCYMPPARGTEPADLEYVKILIDAAKGRQFPSWYIERLESRYREHKAKRN